MGKHLVIDQTRGNRLCQEQESSTTLIVLLYLFLRQFILARAALMGKPDFFVQPTTEVDHLATLAAKGWRARFIKQEPTSTDAAGESRCRRFGDGAFLNHRDVSGKQTEKEMNGGVLGAHRKKRSLTAKCGHGNEQKSAVSGFVSRVL